MNTDRTVAWLAVFMITTPFLAIPDWLLQTVIVIMGLAIISLVWLGQKKKGSAPEDDIPDSFSADDNSSQHNNQDNDSTEDSEPKDSNEHQNIEDPKADTMVAADRWRRRASRDIS